MFYYIVLPCQVQCPAAPVVPRTTTVTPLPVALPVRRPTATATPTMTLTLTPQGLQCYLSHNHCLPLQRCKCHFPLFIHLVQMGSFVGMFVEHIHKAVPVPAAVSPRASPSPYSPSPLSSVSASHSMGPSPTPSSSPLPSPIPSPSLSPVGMPPVP